MAVHSGTIPLQTRGHGQIIDVTDEAAAVVADGAVRNGLCLVFCPGATGSMTTVETEAGALEDLAAAVERIAPRDIRYRHDEAYHDGNGHSHVRAALLGPDVTVPIRDGGLVLGTWQRIIFIDFDARSRSRELVVQCAGDP